MTEMGHIWWTKHSSSAVSGVSGTGSGAGGAETPRNRRQSSSCCLRKFVRKLKKHSKMLCSATRPTTFHCHYDPLSYARNFDDGSTRFYSFSSRFVLSSASAAAPVVPPVH